MLTSTAMEAQLQKLHLAIKRIFANCPSATEVMLQTPSQVFVLDQGVWQAQHLPDFSDGQQLRSYCFYLAQKGQRRLDNRHPFQGGQIDDEFRWHAVIAPAVSSGSCLHLRKMSRTEQLSLPVKVPENFHTNLQEALKACLPIIIYGATGSGKTTLLNTILRLFCLNERVIIIESLNELPLQSALWTKLVSREADVEGLGAISMELLFAQSLRMKPDRIVIGELRTEDANIISDVHLVGHSSTMTTLHAFDDHTALLRLQKFMPPQNKTQVCLIGAAWVHQEFVIRSLTICDQKWF